MSNDEILHQALDMELSAVVTLAVSSVCHSLRFYMSRGMKGQHQLDPLSLNTACTVDGT